jgi:hypothetical protein
MWRNWQLDIDPVPRCSQRTQHLEPYHPPSNCIVWPKAVNSWKIEPLDGNKPGRVETCRCSWVTFHRSCRCPCRKGGGRADYTSKWTLEARDGENGLDGLSAHLRLVPLPHIDAALASLLGPLTTLRRPHLPLLMTHWQPQAQQFLGDQFLHFQFIHNRTFIRLKSTTQIMLDLWNFLMVNLPGDVAVVSWCNIFCIQLFQGSDSSTSLHVIPISEIL